MNQKPRDAATTKGSRLPYSLRHLRQANVAKVAHTKAAKIGSVQIAAAFHDIGIWTAGTFDYLAPSVSEAQSYLDMQRLEDLEPQVRAMIEHHHKVRSYHAAFATLVENYRRADLIDLSLGARRYGLPIALVRSVKAAFPNAGFHRRLLSLAFRQLIREPWRPLPMLRW